MQQQQNVPAAVPVWADPNTAILFIVAAVTFVLCGVLSEAGIGPSSGLLNTSPLVGVLLAAAIGLIILGVIAYRRNDIIFGTAAMVFGALIALGGALMFGFITGLWGIAPLGGAEVMGWYWLAISIILFLLLPAVARVNALLFFAVLELVVAVALLSTACWSGMVMTATGPFFASAGVAHVAGWMILAFGVFCLYAGAAMLTNTIWARPVLPMGPPLSS
jgi:succinate-acetate transporter protein